VPQFSAAIQTGLCTRANPIKSADVDAVLTPILQLHRMAVNINYNSLMFSCIFLVCLWGITVIK